MLDLSSLNQFKKDSPSDLAFIYYLFWDRGISLKEFNELPIPYITQILETYAYVKQQEEKEMNKTKKKGLM